MNPTVCACMGAMYGEPHCYCVMQSRGLPLNTQARKIETERAEKELATLFGPGGLWYRPSLPAISSNARFTKSRNQREGVYAGWANGIHRRMRYENSFTSKEYVHQPCASFCIAKQAKQHRQGKLAYQILNGKLIVIRIRYAKQK